LTVSLSELSRKSLRLYMTRSPTLDIHLHVVGIAAEAVAAALQFLVHVIQQGY
jgi:hypothetical protein